MNYDKVLEEIGELGRWQLVSLSLLALLAASNGVDNTFNVFTGDENIASKLKIDDQLKGQNFPKTGLSKRLGRGFLYR